MESIIFKLTAGIADGRLISCAFIFFYEFVTFTKTNKRQMEEFMIKKHDNNPVIKPSVVKPSMEECKVVGAFNPGAII